MKLEICCYSIDDAKIAQQAGASRIELCSGRSDGGLTPSYGELKQAATANFTIPIHPIVRPRGGDFYYNQAELNAMLNDISLISELGFSGVVLGCLQTNGHIDLINMKKLLKAAKNLSVTFHRAFDVCRDPLTASQQLNDLGIQRLLTSGQKPNAAGGIALLKQLNKQSQSIIIMPGSGIKSGNLQRFIDAGFTEFHSSATKNIPSPMQYQSHNVSMSHRGNNEFLRYGVDGDEVEKMQKMMLDTEKNESGKNENSSFSNT